MSQPNTLLLSKGIILLIFTPSPPFTFMFQLASLASSTHQSSQRADTAHYSWENVVVFLDSSGSVNWLDSSLTSITASSTREWRSWKDKWPNSKRRGRHRELLGHATCKLQIAVFVLNFVINIILISPQSAPGFSLHGPANAFVLDLVWNQERICSSSE